jgi:tRNA (uracil-5-)-methyltransferase
MEKDQDEKIAVKLPSPPEETEQSKLVTEEEDKTDPYAYLNRNEFSSENFKIEIKNLPKYFGVGVIYI